MDKLPDKLVGVRVWDKMVGNSWVYVSPGHPNYDKEAFPPHMRRCAGIRLWSLWSTAGDQPMWVIIAWDLPGGGISETHYREEQCDAFYYIVDEEEGEVA